MTVLVLGGGAAGYFGAIRAAELGAPRVILLEATRTPLQKVRISGGGRCNVTQHQFDPKVLVSKYPRGAKELRGVLSKFGPRETMEWFESRGAKLKVEPDGRVFPTTDDSETICAALEKAAADAGVEVRVGSTIVAIKKQSEQRKQTSSGDSDDSASSVSRLLARLKDGSEVEADAILLATGSNPHGLQLAASLGHTLVPPVPSLFTFDVKDARLDGLAGISVAHVKAEARFPTGARIAQALDAPAASGASGPQRLVAEGPLLITHWGLSAHAVLRLSAWGAREFHASGYRCTLVVDLVPELGDDALRFRADAMRRERPQATLGANSIIEQVPRRLWERIVEHAGGDVEMRWSDVPNRGLQAIVDGLKRATFQVDGKGPFKEEFVTAGGVERKEVDWRSMESRLVPGLFFAGEILDVDALTGGYNLQNAWSTGWLAGSAIGERLASRRRS